jgi:hypothetical protein
MDVKEIATNLNLDPKTAEIYSVYRRASEIYQRTNAAMGKTKKYETSMSSATNVIIKKK